MQNLPNTEWLTSASRSGPAARPTSAGRMLTLSSAALSGSFTPTTSAQVAVRSIRLTS